MIKRRRRKSGHSPRTAREIERELRAIHEQMNDDDPAGAQQRALLLVEKYPRSKKALYSVMELSRRIYDWRTAALHGEKILELVRGEERCDALVDLVADHQELGAYPGLTWYYGYMIIKECPENPNVEQLQQIETTFGDALLTAVHPAWMPQELSRVEKLKFTAQQERLRFFTESGWAKEAVAVAETFLSQFPNAVPALNNASHAYHSLGNQEKAIQLSEQALENAPEDAFALSNLTRFTFLNGRFEESERYAARLRALESERPDLEVKRAEALSMLGDDEGVRDAYERARKEKNSFINDLFAHLAAVAYRRLGDEKRARRLWRDILRRNPDFTMARGNLDDLAAPVGEQNGAWYWPLPYWLPAGFLEKMNDAVESATRSRKEGALRKAVEQIHRDFPQVAALFPHMLDRGDRPSRELVLSVAKMAPSDELHQMLHAFASGPQGADALRIEILTYLAEASPELVPKGEPVPVWLQGRQSETLLMDFEITDEPELDPSIPDAVHDKHERVYFLIQEGKFDEAEQMLEDIIAAAPQLASAYNHLALVYQQQGRDEDARALIEETHRRFPDYLFARTSVAALRIAEDRLEEASALLQPLLQRAKLHISEFRALVRSYVMLTEAQGDLEAMERWLTMWRNVEPDAPELAQWERRRQLRDLRSLTSALSKRFGRSGREKE